MKRIVRAFSSFCRLFVAAGESSAQLVSSLPSYRAYYVHWEQESGVVAGNAQLYV